MSITPKRILIIATIATGIGAAMLPTETVAHVAHQYGAARSHGYRPQNADDNVAPPVVYRVGPPAYAPRIAPECDIARDWNC